MYRPIRIKIVVIGDEGVGKSRFVAHFTVSIYRVYLSSTNFFTDKLFIVIGAEVLGRENNWSGFCEQKFSM